MLTYNLSEYCHRCVRGMCDLRKSEHTALTSVPPNVAFKMRILVFFCSVPASVVHTPVYLKSRPFPSLPHIVLWLSKRKGRTLNFRDFSCCV